MHLHPTGSSCHWVPYHRKVTHAPGTLLSENLTQCKGSKTSRTENRERKMRCLSLLNFQAGAFGKATSSMLSSSHFRHPTFLRRSSSMPCFRPFHDVWSRPFLGASGAEVWEGSGTA